MDLFEAIETRRSVRNYTSQTVEKEKLEALLSAAVQAPSASNRQPWAFAVIQNRALLSEYSTKAKRLLLSQVADDPVIAHYEAMLSKPDFNIFYNAGTLLVICAKPSGLHAEGDCCLAAQNVMLAAHALGLGTCWIGFAHPLLNLPEIKQDMGIPADYTAIAPLIVGYPQGRQPTLPKQAPEIISWQ